MNIKFSDSFLDSLDRVIFEQSKLYKIYSIFRRDLWHFFKNIYRFRKMLWAHRWWDYTFTLHAMQTSLQIMEKGMHKGSEIRQNRDKKIAKMQRAIQIIENIRNQDYIEIVESVVGPIKFEDFEFEPILDEAGRPTNSYTLKDSLSDEAKAHRDFVYKTVDLLEEAEWNELWNIFKGQNWTEFSDNDWDTKFDGSGLRSWWD